MKSQEWWRAATQRLRSGQKLRTFSTARGFGPEFEIVRASNSEIIIAPTSTGDERRLVAGTFEKIEEYLRRPSAELRKKTFNSSYGLGILKHLDLI